MSAPRCYIHPQHIATTTCKKCERPICAEDHRKPKRTLRTQSTGIYCPNCVDQVSAAYSNQMRQIYWVIGIGLVLMIIILGLG